MKMTPGKYSLTGPRCMLKQMDGVRAGRCIDVESDRVQPGGEVNVFPCRGRWHQFLSFGNGTLAPLGSIHMNIPMHIWKRIEDSGREQEPYMCIGVRGRGIKDEEEWIEDISQENEEDIDDSADTVKESDSASHTQSNPSGRNITHGEESRSGQQPGKREILPLSNWKDEQVITTRCSNTHAVVEFVIVLYIEVDTPEQGDSVGKQESEEDEL